MSGKIVRDHVLEISIEGKLKTCCVSSRPLRYKVYDKHVSSILLFRLSSDEHISRHPRIGESIEAGTEGFSDLLGNSPAFIDCKQKAINLAPRTAPVLLTGEIYTGKRSFARAIHNAFGNSRPFVSINCAQLNDAYGSKALFGFEAMSGKISKGLLEQANGGVLLLDCIEKMPPDLQLAFIRYYDERQITRIAGTQRVATSYKILATSCLTPQELEHSASVSREMYFRLSSFIVNIPPLRNRRADIPLLVDSFLEKYYQLREAPFRIKYSNEVVEVLKAYPWPGNVMQLRAAVHYACDVCKHRHITVEDLPKDILRSGCSEPQLSLHKSTSLVDMKRQAVVDALNASRFNITQSARLLGISRTTLYRQIKEYAIHLPIR
ncbi:MAG: sigma 54-interacting transcriptional regulator [Coriobacteriaceae bacterium]|jgi:DNA-binding NtrC family response regulator|nr:sigma 54-interacting transcriptional regulator [Coriobacteriaceae bacterium]